MVLLRSNSIPCLAKSHFFSTISSSTYRYMIGCPFFKFLQILILLNDWIYWKIYILGRRMDG